jgi:hypothetical protein
MAVFIDQYYNCVRLHSAPSYRSPEEFEHAVEFCNAGLLGPDYHKVHETHSVADVYNHWSIGPICHHWRSNMNAWAASPPRSRC